MHSASLTRQGGVYVLFLCILVIRHGFALRYVSAAAMMLVLRRFGEVMYIAGV